VRHTWNRMELHEEKHGRVVAVSVSGRVDGASSPDISKRLGEIAGRGDSHIVLDCADMDYISSAGLRVLLSAARDCQQKGGGLVLCALRPKCRTVFEVSGFFAFLDCHDTRAGALAAASRAAGD